MPPAANPRGFVVLAAAGIDAEGRQWIELMPTASKSRNGPWYFTITPDDLETYAQSIRDQPGLIPVDYDHEGADGGSTRAAGWFTGEAEVRGEVLFAEVKWTPKAVEEIEAGEFKRISPEMSFHKKDAKTGLLTKAKALIAATLTNRPFFGELAPVAAVVWDAGEGYESLRQKVRELLNPGPMDSARYWVIDIAEAHALVQEYSGGKTWVVPFTLTGGEVQIASSSEWVEAVQEWVTAAQEAALANARVRPFAVAAATWTTAYVNDLADSAFLHIKEGGTKDSAGKTKPRSLRMFPVRDTDGKVDLPHLRNALARIPQANLPDDVKQRLARKARSLLNKQTTTKTGADMNPEILKALGLDEDADEAAVLAALAEQKKTSGELQSENETLKAQAEKTGKPDDETELQKLQAELASERTKRITGEREQLLSQAVREGRISPAQKTVFAKAFGGDSPTDETVLALRELIDASPAETIPLKERGSGHDVKPDEDDAEIAKARKAHSTLDEETGRGLEPDDESLSLHVKATKHLTAAGKTTWTEREYLDAVQAVRAAV